MKKRILSAVVYAITTLAVAGFFDGLYGSAPVTHHLGLIHTAIAGTILYASACLLSLFTLRFGVICGFLASILSWPFFGILVYAIPWRSLAPLLVESPTWRDQFAAILMLIIATAFSLEQLWFLFRKPALLTSTKGP
jgi:hypothetical protein